MKKVSQSMLIHSLRPTAIKFKSITLTSSTDQNRTAYFEKFDFPRSSGDLSYAACQFLEGTIKTVCIEKGLTYTLPGGKIIDGLEHFKKGLDMYFNAGIRSSEDDALISYNEDYTERKQCKRSKSGIEAGNEADDEWVYDWHNIEYTKITNSFPSRVISKPPDEIPPENPVQPTTIPLIKKFIPWWPF